MLERKRDHRGGRASWPSRRAATAAAFDALVKVIEAG